MTGLRWLVALELVAIGCTPFTGGQGGGTGSVAEDSGTTATGSTTTPPDPTASPDATTSTAGSGDDPATSSTTTGSTTAADTTGTSDSGEPEPFFRREVVIHGDQVPGDDPLLDFTVLVTFLGDQGLSHVGSGGHVLELDGADILFRDAAMQPLARDLVSYAPDSGRLAFWVRVPEVAGDADTMLYLDYGAPSLVGLAPAVAWNDDYVGVWHFEDDVADGGIILDSSALGSHGTALDMDASNGVPGRVGQGVSFTQPNATVWVGGGVLDLPGPLTFEGWGRMDGPLAANGNQRLFNKGGEFNRQLTLWVSDPTVVTAGVAFGELILGVNYEEMTDFLELDYPVPGFAYGQWHHYAAVVGGPGDDVALFVDGVQVTNATFADPVHTGYPNLYFGNWDVAGDSRRWNGVIDEFRFSDVARTDVWIEAGYRAQAIPQAFCTVGDEQSVP
jgi:hypothetical protein